MRMFLRHIYGLSKSIALVLMLVLYVSNVFAETFNACGTNSIWSAYLVRNTYDSRNGYYPEEVIDFFYPEDFFSGQGARIPEYENNIDPYIVPYFEFNDVSCVDIDSFYIEASYKNKKRFYPGIIIQFGLGILTPQQYQLDFKKILKPSSISESSRAGIYASNKSSIMEDEESLLRYSDNIYDDEDDILWFRYKDGVFTSSMGQNEKMTICKLTSLAFTWSHSGGMVNYFHLEINEDVYHEDFSDCSNAMKYNECSPKEPDKLKIICDRIADCRNNSYHFYVDSNLDDIHWVSLDGLSHDGKDLTFPLEEFDGGCIAAWGQRSPCDKPVYDTICPPLPDLSEKESFQDESICWNEPFYVNGKRVIKSGYYNGLFRASNGCDSIVNYNITVNSGDTTLKDSVYRCGMELAPENMYLYDTIDVPGRCPDLQMSPIVEMSDKRHITISKVKEETDAVYVDVTDNLGNVSYISYWNGIESEHKSDGYFEFNKSGHYTIVAYDEETGCIDSVSFNYSAEIIPDTYFNPDELGNNKWNIKGLEKFSGHRVCIYDRFGKRLICYDGNFDGWDGTYQGHPMPSTDYWYTIEVIDINYNTSGHFTLYRFDK